MAKKFTDENIDLYSTQWKTIDETSYLDEITATTAVGLPSTFTGPAAGFTPGAITVEGIGMYIYTNTVTTNSTASAQLYNITDAVEVAGSTVDIFANAFDAPEQAGSVNSVGWVYGKFSSPISLIAGKQYSVRLKYTGTAIFTYRNATANNWARFLVTSTTSTPTTGDDLYIYGAYSGSNFTPTTASMNHSSSVRYGDLRMGAGAKFECPLSESINYNFHLNANLNSNYSRLDHGAVLEFGNTTNRIPSSSAITFVMSSSIPPNGYGLRLYNHSEFRMYGDNSRGSRIALLNQDAPTGTATLNLNKTVTWKSGDIVQVGTVLRSGTPWTDIQNHTLSSDTTTSSIDLTSGVASYKSGSGYYTTPVGNTTTNSTLTGAPGFIYVKAMTPTVGYAKIELDNTLITNIGSSTSLRRGIELEGGVSSSFKFQDCVISRGGTGNIAIFSITNNHNVLISGSIIAEDSSAPITIQYISAIAACNGPKIFKENLILGRFKTISLANNAALPIQYYTIQDNILNAISANAYQLNISNNPTHITNHYFLCSDQYPVTYNVVNTNIQGVLAVNATIYQLLFASLTNAIISNVTCSSVTTATTDIFNNGTAINTSFNNCFFDTPCNLAFNMTGQGSNVQLNNCTFNRINSNTHINVQSTRTVTATNCSFTGSNIASPTTALDANINFSRVSIVSSGSYVNYTSFGTVQNDKTIYDSSIQSIRLTPSSNITSLQSPLFSINIKSGTTATVSVKVRKSVIGDGTAYNGVQPTLIMKSNFLAGPSFESDTTVATATNAADGAWEILTYTTPTVSDNVTLEFWGSCNGTTGWVNFDSIRVQ
jgi:hypothetical protein